MSTGSIELIKSGTIPLPPIRPQFGYIKTIQRRGNTYMIRDSLPSEDDPAETNGADQMLTDLYHDTIRLSTEANRKASIFKILYFFSTFLTIIGGVVVGILSIGGGNSYLIAALGFVITGIQTFLTTFSIERRGVLLKDVSGKLRKVSRQVRALQLSDSKPKDKMKKLEDYYTEVDELDLSMFDNKITTSPVTTGTKIMSGSGNSAKRGDSDLNNSGDDALYGTTAASNPKPILPITTSDINNKPILSTINK